jgi:hypothetical protein
MGNLDVSRHPFLEWQWKVDIFPEVEFEKNVSYDDFALRIELVYDYRGSYKNIINILKKGVITSILHRYPPDLIVSYVWSVNVPTDKAYVSPGSKRTTIIPIQSNNVIKSRWIKEKRDIRKDLAILGRRNDIVLKKIRIRADTDNSSTMAESGLKYIYLVTGESDTDGKN